MEMHNSGIIHMTMQALFWVLHLLMAARVIGQASKNACIIICVMQRRSDACPITRHHPLYVQIYEYQQSKKKVGKCAKKSWKICCDGFLRFSKCKSCIRCFFPSDAGMQLPLVIAHSSLFVHVYVSR